MTPKAADSDEPQAPEFIYFDEKTNLIAKIESTFDVTGGQFTVAQVMSDYRQVDSVKLSHKMTLIVAGQEQVLTIDSVKNNVEMPDDRFALPQEVQALLKKE
jgi:hypothetical protein